MNLCQEMVIYNKGAIIWVYKNALTHGPVYFGLKYLGHYMESLFHNSGYIF